MQSTPVSIGKVSMRCPKCQARLRAARELMGKKCPCPRCQTMVTVQVPLPSDADILLVMDGSRKDFSHPLPN